MENERFQDLVLEHMARLTQDITGLKSQLSDLDSKVSDLDSKVSSLDSKVSSLDSKVSDLDSKVSSLDSKVSSLDTRVTKMENLIENDILPKLEALFDGQKQMAEQLNRIEKKVDQHDEIIFRRVK